MLLERLRQLGDRRRVLPAMRTRRSGVITHVGSVAAVASLPLISYKLSKVALNELTRWLAFENAPHNIRANLLMLGFIDTPLAIEGYHRATGAPRDQIRAARNQAVPMGRMGTAWEVAATAVFLASDESSYLTGAVLPLDGGSTPEWGPEPADGEQRTRYSRTSAAARSPMRSGS